MTTTRTTTMTTTRTGKRRSRKRSFGVVAVLLARTIVMIIIIMMIGIMIWTTMTITTSTMSSEQSSSSSLSSLSSLSTASDMKRRRRRTTREEDDEEEQEEEEEERYKQQEEPSSLSLSGSTSSTTALSRRITATTTRPTTSATTERAKTTATLVKSNKSRYEERLDACRRMKSVSDIQLCYTKENVRQFSTPSCIKKSNEKNITNWNDIQQCINTNTNTNTKPPPPEQQQPSNKSSPKSKRIRTIHIIGERNSGTKFVMNEIQRCFPYHNHNKNNNNNNKAGDSSNTSTYYSINNIGVKTHRDFIRSKHFFQPVVRGHYSESFVIAIFRNPIDWIESMRIRPYHSPNHVRQFKHKRNEQTNEQTKKIKKKGSASTSSSSKVVIEPEPLPWDQFVSKPWTMNARSLFDIRMLIKRIENETACREGFHFHQVVPCRYTDLHHNNDHNNDDNEKHEHEHEQEKTSTTAAQAITTTKKRTRTRTLSEALEIASRGVGGRSRQHESSLSLSSLSSSTTTSNDITIPSELYRGYEPIYELRHNNDNGSKVGLPYDHIMQLRTDKIINFLLQVPMIIQPGAYMAIRYEDLLMHGTQTTLLEPIAKILLSPQQQQQQQHVDLLPETCKPTPSQPDRLERMMSRRRQRQRQRTTSDNGDHPNGNSDETNVIPLEFQHWIRNNVDMNVERLLGYHQQLIHIENDNDKNKDKNNIEQ